jgi:RimJ/RimL family protein N-acetyltransferase
MAGIKLIHKDSYVTLNYIINELMKPDVRKALFDDFMGLTEIQSLIYSQATAVYGIMQKGLPEPVGVIFFTGIVPYRDCSLYSCVFSAEDRKKGIINEVIPAVRKDIEKRFLVHSVSANIIGKNDASKHILDKMGFEKIGVKPDFIMVNGKYRDLSYYYLILEDGGK